MKGMEFDPERGRRCTECFDMRMERTALYAHENGFHAIATTNATSRWKDAEQVDASGYRAAARYDGLTYWCQNWQSDEMTLRKYEISAKERFYKQEYCGCSYSLRDSNDWKVRVSDFVCSNMKSRRPIQLNLVCLHLIVFTSHMY